MHTCTGLGLQMCGMHTLNTELHYNAEFRCDGNNKRHNIFGLWSIELLKVLENDLINNNYRKVEDWANKIGVQTIDLETKKFDPFFNINTKEDLEEAKKILKKNLND